MNGKPRKKSIQVKLSAEEYDFVRRTFGKAAAAIARGYWLGFEQKAPKNPDAESILLMVRALYACEIEIHRLSRKAGAIQTGGSFADTLKPLQEKFQHLVSVWFSNFSATTR